MNSTILVGIHHSMKQILQFHLMRLPFLHQEAVVMKAVPTTTKKIQCDLESKFRIQIMESITLPKPFV